MLSSIFGTANNDTIHDILFLNNSTNKEINAFGRLLYLLKNDTHNTPVAGSLNNSHKIRKWGVRHMMLASSLLGAGNIRATAPRAIDGGRHGIITQAGTSPHPSFIGMATLAAARPPAEHANPPPRRVKRSLSPAIIPNSAHDKTDLAEQNALLHMVLFNHTAVYLQRNMSDWALVDRVIDNVINRAGALKETARHLFHADGLYGGYIGEPIGENRQKQRVNKWIEMNIFEKRFETYIIELILASAITGHAKATPRFINDNRLTMYVWDRLNATAAPDGPGQDSLSVQSREYIFNEIVLTAMPTCNQDNALPTAHSRWIGSLSWGYWHVGLSFARTLGMNPGNFSFTEAQDLARCLEAMIFSGTVSTTMIRLFQLPALLYHNLHSASPPLPSANVTGSEETTQARDALAIFFSDSKKKDAEHNPFIQFRQALDNFKTRTALARALLAKYCRVDTEDYLARAAESYKNNPGGNRCTESGSRGALKPKRLPNLNKLFNQQNKKIAGLFKKIDLLLVAELLNRVAQEEMLFLEHAAIRRFTADISYQAFAYAPLSGLGPALPVTLASLPAGVDLIAATRGGHERIYALEQKKAGYTIKRIDRNRKDYQSLMNWALPYFNVSWQLNFYQHEVLKSPDQTYLKLVENLALHHRGTLLKQLHQQGYDPTTRDKVLDVLSSFIPFYDCISELRAGDSAAPLSCTLDIIGLLPLIGQTGRLGGRILFKLGMGGNRALRASLLSFSAERSLTVSLATGAKSLTVNALAPAMSELNRRAFLDLALSSVRALDPGIEFIGFIGKTTLRQLIAGAEVMKNQISVMNKILPALRIKTMKTTAIALEAQIKTGKISGLDEEISVIRLDGDKYKRKDVYVRIDQETGEISGKKYIFSHNGSLQPVHSAAAKNLRNILSIGLSGRGAGNAARLWNSAAGHSSLKQIKLVPPDETMSGAAAINSATDASILPVENIVHTLRYGTPESEAVLFPEFGVNLTQEPLDLAAYEAAFYALPDEEISAIRQWTQIENCCDKYSDLASDVSNDEYPAMHAKVNQNLMDKKPFVLWDPDEKTVYDNLLSVFSRNLPTHQGEYLRVARYAPGAYIPWGDIIGPGDVVTNFPIFMSVSSEDNYAIGLAKQTGADMAAGTDAFEALIFYKIDQANQCLPLAYPIASLLEHEQEYLYKPLSFFKVKSVASGYHVDGPMLPHTRIAVVLEELPASAATAKNLFTGEIMAFED